MIDISIRMIDLPDLDVLQQISRDTFQETFADSNTQENMDRYLSENLTREKLASEIANPDSSFYFAELGTNVLGYLKINSGRAQSEKISDRSVEIERIYVCAAYHGKGLGKLLFDHALAIALEKNADQVWLGVWEHNLRAIAFYRKNGFEEFDQHVFMLGDDKQTDILMRRFITI
jgi:ribosomal protein S18 acetylase RimI-like enzyme